MGLMRLGIANTAANTDTKIFTATEPYLVSVIATNKSTTTAANLRVWVQPSGATLESQYAFIVYDLPVDASNSYETFRFAVNPGDELYVRASTANISWQSYGLVQLDVKLGAGVVSWSPSAPTNPVNGMIWVDSDAVVNGGTAKPIYIYDAANSSWVATSSAAIDQSGNYSFTGTISMTNLSVGSVSSTEISYLDGVTSAIQTQLNGKEKTIPLQSSAPSSPVTSDIWIDNTSPTEPIVKVYDGSSWVVAGSTSGYAPFLLMGF